MCSKPPRQIQDHMTPILSREQLFPLSVFRTQKQSWSHWSCFPKKNSNNISLVKIDFKMRKDEELLVSGESNVILSLLVQMCVHPAPVGSEQWTSTEQKSKPEDWKTLQPACVFFHNLFRVQSGCLCCPTVPLLSPYCWDREKQQCKKTWFKI